MLEWVIKEIVKEDQAKQAATKKDIPEEVEAPEKRKWTRLTYLLVILPLLLIAIGMFLH